MKTDIDYSMIRNALCTPDGTILRSRHRHDYVTHKDANGKVYMLDGGLSYVRSSANGDEEHLTVTLADPQEQVREALEWGTYGKDSDQPLSYIKLCDMSTAHVNAVLANVPSINPAIKVAMERDVEFRENGKE